MYCPHHLQMLINLAWCCPHHLQKSVSMIQKIQWEVPLFVHMGCVNDSEETLRKRRVLSTSVGSFFSSNQSSREGTKMAPGFGAISVGADHLHVG